MLIIWKDEFAIDGGIIDDDHKKIIEIINEIITAIRAQEHIGSVALALKALHEITTAHFFREESLQELSEFPDLSRHRTAHRKLLATLSHWVETVDKSVLCEDFSTQNDVLSECKTFLYRWILAHILADDMEMREYIEDMRRSGSALLSQKLDEVRAYADFNI
jgi:hemerythrin-like metal-binding protein